MLEQTPSLPTTIALLCFATAFLLFYFSVREVRSESVDVKLKRLGFSSGKHSWEAASNSISVCYVCKRLMSGWLSNLLECRKCGLQIHSLCRLTRKLPCKYICANGKRSQNLHQWVDGSLPLNAICDVCKHLCTAIIGSDGKRCLWCQRNCHYQCLEKMSQQCDFGSLRPYVFEPNEVLGGSLLRERKARRVTSQNSESQEQYEKTTIDLGEGKMPVVAVINKKSGGQLGSQFLSRFYRCLNPIQVVALPGESLERLKLFLGISGLRVVVGGGDGTIVAVANYLKETCAVLGVEPPPISVIPLGTGNDLSRTLGWGCQYQDFQMLDFLERTTKAEQVGVDRWRVKVWGSDPSQEPKEFLMYNYTGIGLDAKFCLQFHELRENYPQLFFSQLSNKFIYSQMGAIDFAKSKVGQQQELLGKGVEVRLDGRPLDLAGIENVVVLNINHWGGGAEPLKGKIEQSFSDQRIEVFAIENVIHLGQVQIGLDEVVLLGQGRVLEVVCNERKKVFTHVDGEPFKLHGPFRMVLEWDDRVPFLAQHQSERTRWQGALCRELAQLEREGVVSHEQRASIQQRLSGIQL